MADVERLITENLAPIVAALVALDLLLVVLTLIQSLRLGRALRAYRALVADGAGGSLHEVLTRHIGRVNEANRRLEAIGALHDQLERRSRGSLQHVGLVRFNPFDDTGSDQSFAIALLDDRRDGVVVSSLHGRSHTRVFAKPVEAGSSKHVLSAEEAQAIRIALDGTTASSEA